MKNTLIVNLFGGPGCGKSTGAAYIFSQLKMAGYDAELVTEFAKDKTWEGNLKALSNQFYIFGKQCFRLSRVCGDVDVIVTDSPLLLSNYYAGNDPKMENFKKACLDVFNSYNNINFILNRVKPYNKNGRNQTLLEAVSIDCDLLAILNDNNIMYRYVDGCEYGYEEIVKDVKDRLSNKFWR